MNTDLTVPGDATPAPSERPQVPAISGEFVRARLPEVGRIRCGEKDAVKGYPKRLKTFRFTSRERPLIERVAELYGGEVKPWASDEGPQWQVVSEANSIQVIVPTADLAFSQYFELWDGGGCQRRCDGHYEMLGDRQCVCNPADRAAGKEGSCKPTTRLGVFLPGVRGLGVWRLESHGKNAGSEIKGAVMLVAAYGAGLTRATLTTAIRPGRQRKPDGSYTPVRYVVPTLIPDDDIDQYVDRAQLEASGVRGVLPSSHDYPAPTDDKMRELFAAWNKAFPKPDEMNATTYRGQRLEWSSDVLRRAVYTWNGPEDPEHLTRSEVQVLLDELARLQAAPGSGPAAGPLAPEHPGPANISAGVTMQAPAQAGSETPPAEHHMQGSVATGGSRFESGTQGGGDPSLRQTEGRVARPAEHHSDEELGEVPSPEGVEPGGWRASHVLGASPGPAPAPTRKRTGPKPGKPNIPEAQRVATAVRNQTTTEHEPTDALHFIGSPTFRQLYVAWFENQAGGDWSKGMEDARRHAQAHLERLRSEGAMGDEFARPQLEAMAAETFERKP